MTTLTAAPPTVETVRARAGAACLVGGAVALALSRALSYEGGSAADRLEQVAGHDAQVSVSAALAFLGFAALIPGFLAVAGRVRDRGAVLATVGAGLCVAGFVGFTVLAAMDLPLLAASHLPRTSGVELLHHLDPAPAVVAVTPVAVAGFFLGPFLVALAARRAGMTPVWLAWAVLGCLVLQPVLLGALGGPGLTLLLVDTVLQLALVAPLVVLARRVLAPGATRG